MSLVRRAQFGKSWKNWRRPKRKNPKKERAALDPAEDISLDDTGNVVVPEEIVIGKSNELFGNKIYAAPEAVEEVTSGLSKDPFHIENTFHKVQDAVQKQIKKEVIDVANKKLSAQTESGETGRKGGQWAYFSRNWAY